MDVRCIYISVCNALIAIAMHRLQWPCVCLQNGFSQSIEEICIDDDKRCLRPAERVRKAVRIGMAGSERPLPGAGV